MALAERTRASVPGSSGRAWIPRRCLALAVGGHLEPAWACVRKAMGLAARELGASAETILEEAGLVLVGHSSLKAALDLDWGQPKAREQALHLVLEEVDRWKTWLEQHQRLWRSAPSEGSHGHHHPDYHAGHRTRPGG